ncbi:Zinc finger MYM-type protein 1, partial [Frankliniella fusca]
GLKLSTGFNRPFFVGVTVERTEDKVSDLKLAAMVACHCSLKSVDHLTELTRDLGKGSTLEHVRLHRTKCTKLVERVIAPSLLEKIVGDIGDGFYSIICDESTDIATKKQLALCVRYYDQSEDAIVTHYLSMIETPRATAVLLYAAFKEFMAKIGLPLTKLLGLGTDGGQNLCGVNESLYALLKRNDCPHLMLIKCICHSLDKCASYASKELPSSLEYQIRESRNWFCHSSVRKQVYKELHEEMFGVEPPLLVRLASTRWLSFYGAVKTHLDQYNALKELFTREAAARDPCPTVVHLKNLHDDGSNLLLLTFLKPVLRELTQINVIFQHTYADITKIYTDLRVFVFSIAQRIIRPEALVQSARPGMLQLTELEALKSALSKRDSLKPLDLVNFGEAFRVLAQNMERGGLLSREKINIVKSACANFLIRLCKELTERLPSSIAEIEKLRFLSPSHALSKRGRPSFASLPLGLIPHNFDVDLLDGQWNSLGALSPDDILNEGETVESIDIVKFWSRLFKLENGAGQRPYKELAFCALSLFCLPLSNAIVERVFSIMNVVKTKHRNRFSNSVLNAVLLLRLYLKAHKKCCLQFEPSEAMLRRFNSRDMYDYALGRHRAAAASGAAGKGKGGLSLTFLPSRNSLLFL